MEQYLQDKLKELRQEEQAIKQMEMQLIARKGGYDRLRHTVNELAQKLKGDGKQEESPAEDAKGTPGATPRAPKRGKGK